MSFALHTGSAIEGAIGSEFKVDASYLSTDLQILHRIDQLCDVYDRTILITGDLQKMMSDRAKETTRKIETILMKESPTTQRVSYVFLICQVIYCIDIAQSESIHVEGEQVELLPGEFYKHADTEGALSQQITKGVEYVFQVDHDFVCMKKAVRPDFVDAFERSIRNYAEGDWINASGALSMAMSLGVNDGPSKWLYAYLEKNKQIVPEGWAGVRDIDKKLEPPPIDFIKHDDQEFYGEEEQDISADKNENS